ncbi:MAG: DUF1800 family protein [Verrucomicrobiota bacterium]
MIPKLRFLGYLALLHLNPDLSAQTPTTTGGKGLDLDGDGMSDIWEAFYDATSLAPDQDADNDGVSNLKESLIGTNPFVRTAPLRLERFEIVPARSEFDFSWMTVPNKAYHIEWSDSLGSWQRLGSTQNGTGSMINMTAADPNRFGYTRFFRLVVSDQDADNDGLLAYEEAMLGFDDNSRNTARDSAGTDYEKAIRLAGGSTPFNVGGKSTQPTKPSMEEASRFLVQATLGADYELIQQVSQTGFSDWLDQQFALPPTFHLPRNGALGIPGEFDDDPSIRPFIWSWWDVNMKAPDLLRQRVAFALSEILVVSEVGSDLFEDVQWGLTGYYDLLVKHSFGNYEDLLFDVSMSPVMGNFLTHARNRKADLATNRFPDENYARELMQLFTIGLYELNQDGTRKTDANGNGIPTYSNKDIREFARIFTGLTYNPAPPPAGIPYDDDPDDPFVIESEDEFLTVSDVHLNMPMFAYEPLHDTDPKQLLSYTTINSQVVTGQLPANQTTEQDIRGAISNLFNHPNTGPFVSRLLIQRLIKSNPSPAYISRVAAAFNDNGQGIRGDMQAVIRAILLDPEARNRGFLNDPTNGMLREPYIRYLHICRAFNLTTVSGNFRVDFDDSSQVFKQRPLAAPSVFNFFLPDHAPKGQIKDLGLVAPEFQITTSTTSVAAINFWVFALGYGEFMELEQVGPTEDYAMPDLEDEAELWEDSKALVDRLDIILTYGSMNSNSKQTIEQALTDIRALNIADDWDVVLFALNFFANSPDFAVLK